MISVVEWHAPARNEAWVAACYHSMRKHGRWQGGAPKPTPEFTDV